MKLNFFSTIFLLLATVLRVYCQQVKSVYKSEILQIAQISPNTFVHLSFLNTEDFGKVECNGMIVINKGEALVFDTPANDDSSLELINWLEKEQELQVTGVVATHFHWDCLGGLNEFHAKGIPSYGSFKTLEFAEAAGYPVPKNGFNKKMTMEVGGIKIINQFLGEGHTRDNFVAYVPSDKVIFGGCMIKSMGAGNGNLEDANVSAWPSTVSKVKSKFPETKIVIPGHGEIGGTELLDYTIELFSK